MKKFGFSLAEVLITLGVIGVVAALTIPSLYGNYQKKQYATALKKDYTTVMQAFRRMVEDEDAEDILSTEFSDLVNAYGDNSSSFTQYITKYFPNAKYISGTASYKYRIGHSTYTGIHSPYHYKRIDLPDTTYYFSSQGYDYNHYWNSSSKRSVNGYGAVYVDVNGANKGPNRVGVDFFGFYYDSELQYYPNSGSSCTGSSGALSCFRKVMDDGWEIKYY
ncbi:MAG: prepilin-type N-terminal cleavage/methylation domain-containing protein [Bacteroidota bacterium]|nr:prepilin-type N-terminal cleavage/methylation domain-containing protein [Bacteroidota bacterium]